VKLPQHLARFEKQNALFALATITEFFSNENTVGSVIVQIAIDMHQKKKNALSKKENMENAELGNHPPNDQGSLILPQDKTKTGTSLNKTRKQKCTGGQ